jgi:hypothetical protein
MAASPASPAVQAVLNALDALYNKPEKQAKDEANTWLQNFQKTVGGVGASDGSVVESYTSSLFVGSAGGMGDGKCPPSSTKSPYRA